jgi:hypothetical protein
MGRRFDRMLGIHCICGDLWPVFGVGLIGRGFEVFLGTNPRPANTPALFFIAANLSGINDHRGRTTSHFD